MDTIAGEYAINWWSDVTLEERVRLCVLLGWPPQYAEGTACDEWLTEEQLQELRSITYEQLDNCQD